MTSPNLASLDPEAALFDLDGTLIDSINVYIRILNNAFRHIGVPEAPREQVLDAIRDGGFDWGMVLTEFRGSEREDIIREAKSFISEIYRRCIRPGGNY